MKNLPGSRRHVAFNSLTAIGADAIDLQARLAPTRARLTARLALHPHALPRAARQGTPVKEPSQVVPEPKQPSKEDDPKTDTPSEEQKQPAEDQKQPEKNDAPIRCRYAWVPDNYGTNSA